MSGCSRTSRTMGTICIFIFAVLNTAYFVLDMSFDAEILVNVIFIVCKNSDISHCDSDSVRINSSFMEHKQNLNNS